MSLSVGDILDDRYVLLARLGEGGQGTVWKALDRLPPNRHVALKLISVDRISAGGLERMRREAAALHKLSHPSLVTCHRMFEDLSRHLVGLVLDLVEGSTVDDVLADARFSEAGRRWVLMHLASVLWYLHERGLVHRDLKPENVLLGAGFWAAPDRPENLKLIDLGIAAIEGNPHPVTDPGRIIGTAPFMAPEVIDPETFRAPAAGPTRDVFAFGVMGWMLLAGGHPSGVEQGDLRAYATAYRRALRGETRWPHGEVAGSWGQILRSCVALRAADRPPSGREIAEAVQGLRTALPAPSGTDRASIPSRTETAPRWAPPMAPTVPNEPYPAAVLPPPRAVIPPRPSSAAPRKRSWLVYLFLCSLVMAAALLVWRVRLGEGDPSLSAIQWPSRPTVAPQPSTPPAPSPGPSLNPPIVRESPLPAPGPVGAQKTLRDNAFAAACCDVTNCEMTSAADKYFQKWEGNLKDGQCGCPSGNKLLGCCEQKIPRGQTWELRLSNMVEMEPDTGRKLNVVDGHRRAQVCVKKPVQDNTSWHCKLLSDIKTSRGVSMGFRATTEDLEMNGIDLVVFEDDSQKALLARRMGAVSANTPIGPGALCVGLKFTGFNPTHLNEPYVAFFLDAVP